MRPRSLFVASLMPFALTLARAQVQIERTILPFDAAPSSFAIGLPGGVNFCYDPVRGGVSYAWTGNFADISSVRPGAGAKYITPIKLNGPVVYRESGDFPLRRGDPTHVPVYEFKGYTLSDTGVEFRYTLDGLLVHEFVRALDAPGGGLMRRFVFEAGGDAKWWYVVEGQPARELAPSTNGSRFIRIDFPAP